MFATTRARLSVISVPFPSTRIVVASTSTLTRSGPIVAPFSTSRTRAAPTPKPTPTSSTTSHLTPSEAESKKIEEANTTPPAYLARALGVRDRPTKGKPSREEWRANLLSKERRINERKHLVKEVSKGYFNDYNELRHKGGKKWIAPNTLIREDLSLFFPDIEGVSLATKQKTHTIDLFKDKVSLVALGSFKSSEEHINSFVRPALSDMKDEPLYQYVYINAQENPLKSFLVSMFISSLRRQVEPRHQPTYLLSHQSLEYLREPMGMTNKHVGYVYLVDWNGKVRWAGCDWATLQEEEALRKCSHVLVERLKKDKEELMKENKH